MAQRSSLVCLTSPKENSLANSRRYKNVLLRRRSACTPIARLSMRPIRFTYQLILKSSAVLCWVRQRQFAVQALKFRAMTRNLAISPNGRLIGCRGLGCQPPRSGI